MVLMYEDRTQNYDPEIHEVYLILIQYSVHPILCHIIYSHAQIRIQVKSVTDHIGDS